MNDYRNYQAPKSLLNDKIILVTGAGDGIGRTAAIAYAEHGATVILCGRTVEKLEAVYDEISNRGLPQAAIIPIDFNVAEPADYKELAKALADNFGRLDGLLNNAGILGQKAPIENIKADKWREVIQVNVNAPFMLTQALLPLLKASDNASIIFTSSGVGRKGRAYWGAYGVSKFATEGLMETLADELESTTRIRCNCINPGATNTSMRRSAYPGEEPSCNPAPEEIMNTYLWLMGKESGEINGESLDAQ